MVVKPATKRGFSGFEKLTESTARNQFWETCGLEYTGKSRFACTFPEPIIYLAVDPGYVRGVASFAGRKEIYTKKFHIPDPEMKINQKRVGPDGKPRQEAVLNYQAYQDLWDEWIEAWYQSIASEAKTIVVDTGTEVWNFARGARFGKLAQVMPQDYTSMNLEFEAIIRKGTAGEGCDKHVVWIEKMKKQYTQSKDENGKDTSQWNGKWEPSGFSGTGYVADIRMEHFTHGGIFGVRFLNKTGTNNALIGSEFINDEETLGLFRDFGVGDVCCFDFLMKELYQDGEWHG